VVLRRAVEFSPEAMPLLVSPNQRRDEIDSGAHYGSEPVAYFLREQGTTGALLA
jgi:hypothetical protein